MLFYDLSIIRDSQNQPPNQGFLLYGELPKEKLQKLALKALRSHEIFKERRHKEPPHTSNMLYTTYIAFFHFIACWYYCQIMSRVTLHNFWPKIVKRKSYYLL